MKKQCAHLRLILMVVLYIRGGKCRTAQGFNNNILLTYSRAGKCKRPYKSFLQRICKGMQKQTMLSMLNIDNRCKPYTYAKLFNDKGKYLSGTEQLEASKGALSCSVRR